MHPISILPSRFGTTARAQNWRTSARINWLKPTKLSVADDSDSVIPRVCPTPSCNTQAFPFEHLSLYYAKLNSCFRIGPELSQQQSVGHHTCWYSDPGTD